MVTEGKYTDIIGKKVHVIVDRPAGSYHPRNHGKMTIRKGWSFYLVSPAGLSVRSIVAWDLVAGPRLLFALTNSGRLPLALPTGEMLPSFAHSLTGRVFESTRLKPTKKGLSQNDLQRS